MSNAALDRAARRVHPPTTGDERSAWESRSLFIQRTLDGVRGRLTAHLPGESLDVVESAVRDRADRIPVNPETGVFDRYPMRMADGLVEVCSTSGDRGSVPPQITVHADLEALMTENSGVAETGLGSLLANETARRLACDSVVECAVFDQGRLVGVGRNTRQIPG